MLTQHILSRSVLRTLREKHRIMAEGGIPPMTYDAEKERSRLAEQFGRLKSGVDIRMLWPTVEEIEEQQALKLYRKYEEVVDVVAKEEDTKRKAAAKRAMPRHGTVWTRSGRTQNMTNRSCDLEWGEMI
ncbi:hypothetical protein L596_009390 [Steinernema carpocapsae]|uniref:Uncharacterized protein n=1 Tax=Steinernema carpocapsae TaxID=34508 RepID=A0A4U5PG06_STECR|nr:hypothetical protein L596_009390 [Steinernema carpocapsae]